MSEHQADIVGRNGSALSDLLDAPRLAGAGAPETPRDESTDGPDVVDDVFDEFLMRCQAGEDLDPDRFCDEHPSIKSSLRKVLAAQLACAA
ncbi:MAG: hypothetical protein HYS12_19370, partial [Planctomycetes bacterium]|nr:hypothetical protein [Planctomycetota bacterium]